MHIIFIRCVCVCVCSYAHIRDWRTRIHCFTLTERLVDDSEIDVRMLTEMGMGICLFYMFVSLHILLKIKRKLKINLQTAISRFCLSCVWLIRNLRETNSGKVIILNLYILHNKTKIGTPVSVTADPLLFWSVDSRCPIFLRG